MNLRQLNRRSVALYFLFTFAGRVYAQQPAEDPRRALATPSGQEKELTRMASQSQSAAAALSQATEIAISPLLVMTAMGAVRWFRTPGPLRSELPFYVQPWVWGMGLVLLALVFFKETVVARVPLLKKPLDVLQLFENKLTGLVASPVAIGGLAYALHTVLSRPEGAVVAGLFRIGNAEAAGFDGQSAVSVATWILAVVGASVMYFAVWMASHSINVLVLLSPFGLVDNVLKLSRLGLLALVALSSQIHPYVGAFVCALVMVAALLVSGWSFRLMRFGVSFSWGMLAKPKSLSGQQRIAAFSGRGLPVPIRTRGQVFREQEQVVFAYRRFFVFLKKVTVPGPLRIERGLIHPVLLSVQGGARRVVCRFTPQFSGQEQSMSDALGANGVDDAPLKRGFRSVAQWFEEAATGAPDELDGSMGVPPRG